MNRGLMFVVICLLLACRPSQKSPQELPVDSDSSGEALAHIYCSGCHLFPEPDLLSQQSWKDGVLPAMAFHLGIRSFTEKLGEIPPDELDEVIQSGNYPAAPTISANDWQKIVSYYRQNAPEKSLPQEWKKLIRIDNACFTVQKHQSESSSPMVSMVKMDAANQCFWVCEREKLLLSSYSYDLKPLRSVRVNSPVSDIAWKKDGGLLALEIGIMEPNDSKKGLLIQFDATGNRKVLLRSLKRPVHLTMADLNWDGIDDYLICNYGNESGNLSWYDGQTLEEHRLKNAPGARITVMADMNGDGKADIVALFCQAREVISIFYQKEKGQYEESIVQQFPPVYGSSCLDVADMNADSKPDIIYTNGDNADYSNELKRYHGVRIFLNEDENKFTEQYFCPVHGAGNVRALDVDKDGLMDLAVTSFFPDNQQAPNEGFLLFRQKANLQFEIITFSEASLGRWLVMDTGDLNQDGKPDIILGNFVKAGLGQRAPIKNTPAFILLTLKKHLYKQYD